MRILRPIRTGFEVPRGALNDTDRDGVPNFIDCKPRDPTRQGFLGEIITTKLAERKGIVGRVTRAYQGYAARAPEREKARIEALRRKVEIEKQRAEITKARATRVIAARPPSMDYGKFFGLGAGVTPVAKVVKRKRAKKRRKR